VLTVRVAVTPPNPPAFRWPAILLGKPKGLEKTMRKINAKEADAIAAEFIGGSAQPERLMSVKDAIESAIGKGAISKALGGKGKAKKSKGKRGEVAKAGLSRVLADSGKATPAKATPAKATPAKATPAKATPAKATPAKASKAPVGKTEANGAAPATGKAAKASTGQSKPTGKAQATPAKATPAAKGKATPAKANGNGKPGRPSGYTDSQKIVVLKTREGRGQKQKLWDMVTKSKTIGAYKSARAKAGLKGLGGVFASFVNDGLVKVK
jgi:hypothetical protein